LNSPSNSAAPFIPAAAVFLQNCTDFAVRFPDLAAGLELDRPETALQQLQAMPQAYRLVQAKAKGCENAPALTINGAFLHSKYNPEEEALRLLNSEFFLPEAVHRRCCFAGLGLGYLAEQYIERFPAAEAVIIEPDISVFICFLAARRRASFFRHRQLSLLIGTQPEEAASFLSAAGWNDVLPFKHAASVEAHKGWFDVFFTVLERHRMKTGINAKTLERFGKLWLKNTVKNLDALCSAPKMSCFKNAFTGVPAVVLAGGPSLTEHLAVIKKSGLHFLIIAVDTAMRACLRAGITPDFVLSFDPQYWNYLHTAGLDTSASILISEAAVFPAVLRQRYRAVFLSNSSAPFARYLEQNADTDCVLAAGGSVATTAWDFARYTGAQPIVMAGLDLAYPRKQTHFSGSTFEEAVHTRSSRLSSAEQANVIGLYSAFPSLREDYTGGTGLTDRRMLLYAWWFESALAKNPDSKTYNLMPQGLAVPGMPACTAEAFTELVRAGIPRSVIRARLQTIIDGAYSETFLRNRNVREQNTAASVKAMRKSAAALAAQAEKAEALCRRLAQCADTGNNGAGRKCNAGEQASLIAQLDQIDEKIRSGFAKELVSVLFFNGESGGVQNGGTESGNSSAAADAQKSYERIRLMALQVYEIFTNR